MYGKLLKMTYDEVKTLTIKALSLLEPQEILFAPEENWKEFDEDWLEIVIISERFRGLSVLTRIEMCLHLLLLRAPEVEKRMLVTVLPFLPEEFEEEQKKGIPLFGDIAEKKGMMI